MSVDNKEHNKISTVLENNIGTLISTLIIAFVIGTITMIYNSDKNNEIFKTQLTFINQNMIGLQTYIEKLEMKIEQGTKSRWTRNDQRAFEDRIQVKIETINTRMLRNESNILENLKKNK